MKKQAVFLGQKRPWTGFYTKLNVWGSLGLNFDYDGGPIIENGGPIFLYKHRILEGSTSFCEGIRTGLSCQTGAENIRSFSYLNHLVT